MVRPAAAVLGVMILLPACGGGVGGEAGESTWTPSTAVSAPSLVDTEATTTTALRETSGPAASTAPVEKAAETATTIGDDWIQALPPLPESPWPAGGLTPEDEVKYRIQGALSNATDLLTGGDDSHIVQAAFLGEGADHHLVWYVSEPQPELQAKIDAWLESKGLPSHLIRLVLVPHSREELDAIMDEAYAVMMEIAEADRIPADMYVNVYVVDCSGEVKWVSSHPEQWRELLVGTGYEDAEIVNDLDIVQELKACTP